MLLGLFLALHEHVYMHMHVPVHMRACVCVVVVVHHLQGADSVGADADVLHRRAAVILAYAAS